MRQFKVWTFGCSHIVTDARRGAPNTLADAIRDAESYGFDIAVNLGDVAGKKLPRGRDGALWRQQLMAVRQHNFEDFYSLAGNHDRTDAKGVAALAWFRRHVDPFGEFPRVSGIEKGLRKFPLYGKAWRYKIRVGNLIFLFLSDVNRPETPGRSDTNGDPGGVVTSSTYAWWKRQCERYRGNAIVVTCAHYLPHETTTASGDYEGGTVEAGEYHPLYHGPGATRGRCSSYLAFVDETPGHPFIEHLAAHPGDCALWIASHTHAKPGKRIGGKAHVETLHGCTFVQCGALTRHHHGPAKESYPRSRFLTFSDGSAKVKIEALMHADSDVASKGVVVDFRVASLPRAFAP